MKLTVPALGRRESPSDLCWGNLGLLLPRDRTLPLHSPAASAAPRVSPNLPWVARPPRKAPSCHPPRMFHESPSLHPSSHILQPLNEPLHAPPAPRCHGDPGTRPGCPAPAPPPPPRPGFPHRGLRSPTFPSRAPRGGACGAGGEAAGRPPPARARPADPIKGSAGRPPGWHPELQSPAAERSERLRGARPRPER